MEGNELGIEANIRSFHILYLGVLGGLLIPAITISIILACSLGNLVQYFPTFLSNSAALSVLHNTVLFLSLQVLIVLFISFCYINWFHTPSSIGTWIDKECSVLKPITHQKLWRSREYRFGYEALPMIQSIHLKLHFGRTKESLKIVMAIPFHLLPKNNIEDQLRSRGFRYDNEQHAIVVSCQPEELWWNAWQIIRLQELDQHYFCSSNINQ